MEEKEITIVIPVYNGQDKLRLCLDSIKNIGYNNYSVIVVDDASTDDSRRVAESFRCEVISLPENMGAGYARDMGIKRANGEIVAFIDSDCIVPADYLKKVDRYLTKELGGIGGVYRPYDRKSTMSLFFTAMCDYYFFAKMEGVTDFIPGGAANFWREVLMEERPKNDLLHFRKMASGEDVVMCYEISRKHKIVLNPDLYVTHIAPDLKRFIKQQSNWGYSRTISSFLLFKNKFLFARDTRMTEQVAQILSVIVIALSIPLYAVTGQTLWFYAGLTVYIASVSPFLYYIGFKYRDPFFLISSFFLTGLRNLCLIKGLFRGIIYIATKLRFNPGGH